MSVWLLGSVLAVPASAEELTGREIVKRADDLLRGESLHGRYAMTVETPAWQRRLELEVWMQGRERTFIRIHAPAKEAGTATLRIGSSMWNYLPQVERTIKIPPSMMLQPWMGSDFTNDDLVKESSLVNDYTHEITGTESAEGGAAYRITLTPKPKAAVTWGRLAFWIRRHDFVPLREEYYDERGALVKVLTYSDIRAMSDRVIPTRWEMVSQATPGHRTVIEVREATYNQPIAEEVFTLANLQRVR